MIFFMVFLLVFSVFNILLFRNIRSGLIEAFEKSVQVEAESIARPLLENPTEIPLTKEDQPIQVWFNSLMDIQKIYERIDFPKEYSEFFSAMQNEGFSNSESNSTILELDNFTFCIFNQETALSQAAMVSLVLAKDNTATYSQIQKIAQWMILANFVAAVLAMLAALSVSRFTLKPIQELILKAQSIKASEEMERLPVSKANDELTQLSQTINQMIERIESSIKSQNQFFTSAAHELRTPLANMLAELELKISENSTNQDKSLLLSQREEVVRLKYVVQDFLLMSQLKSDTIRFQKVPFRIDDLLYDILEKMNHSVKASGFEINVNIDSTAKDIDAVGDIIKMESILVNLLQNALKYGDRDESIKIRLQKDKSSNIIQFVNKIDFVKQNQSGNQLGLWICGQLSEKQGFVFSYQADNTHFHSTLEIPFNGHS